MTTYTLIEFMPIHLRASHIDARNSGRYPFNGAVRIYVEGALDSSDLHPVWAEIIEDGIRSLPQGAEAEPLPDDALPLARDLDDEAACRADYEMDMDRDDRLTGDR